MKLQLLVLRVQGPAGVVLAALQLVVHGLEEHLVCGLTHDEAGLVHQSHDALMRLINEFTNDLEFNV